MAEQESKSSKAEKAKTPEQLRDEYQKLTDPKERKAFFEANPTLREFVSALNHS